MNDKKSYRIYVCNGAQCASRGNTPIYRELDRAVYEHGLDEVVDIYMSGCQDRCDYGPNITVWPGPYRYARLTREAARLIIEQHVRDGCPVEEWNMQREK